MLSERQAFYQQKANFAQEQRNFTEAAIRLAQEVGTKACHARKSVFNLQWKTLFQSFTSDTCLYREVQYLVCIIT